MKLPTKNILLKLALIASPALLWCVWQAYLPLQQYSFRAWEPLLVQSKIFKEPFYPNQAITMTEVGDLAPYTVNAIPKTVWWQTDESGYRNTPQLCRDPEWAVLGDSMAVGTSLSQEETVSVQLMQKIRACVRSYAGGKLYHGIQKIYGSGLKPKKLVIVLAERNFTVLRELEKVDSDSFKIENSKVGLNGVLSRFLHLRKNIYWNYMSAHGVWASIERSFQSPESALKLYAPRTTMKDPPRPDLLFFGSTELSEGLNDEQIQNVVSLLDRFSQQMHAHGTEVIFTLAPNKESIYRAEETHFNGRLKAVLARNEHAFEYIDLISEFRKRYLKEGVVLHQSDDSHWNGEGVKVLVEAMTKQR